MQKKKKLAVETGYEAKAEYSEVLKKIARVLTFDVKSEHIAIKLVQCLHQFLIT